MEILSIVERLAGVAADWITIVMFGFWLGGMIVEDKPEDSQAV